MFLLLTKETDARLTLLTVEEVVITLKSFGKADLSKDDINASPMHLPITH